ncbi:IS3 family transposase [Pseudactinotalea terrae]|uniref:IS3 family transposase n=1 Tax=Pseudactinotalea terrae TaxID=1743262 RepID=UPI0012E1DC6B|nr:IS3 family transposase [Pseudactinotalea terrae]
MQVGLALVAELKAAGNSQRAALALVGMSRSTWHYHHQPRPRAVAPVPQAQRRAASWLHANERAAIEAKLQAGYRHGWSVYHCFYQALDAGDPVASLSSWYRVARVLNSPARPARRTRRHRSTATPQALATAPMQLWSWDITHLKGPYFGVTYQLYLIMDVFSRRIVGWRIEEVEDDDLAQEMFRNAFAVHGSCPLRIHSDGGPSMTSRTVTGLFQRLGIEISRNRPRVSNDNPFSEALFKTAKYAPTYPDYFNDVAAARAWATHFVDWYNHQHHHSALEGHTPASLHDGTWIQTHHRRVTTMGHLYQAHPERFRARPVIHTPMAQVAINHPTTDDRLQTG